MNWLRYSSARNSSVRRSMRVILRTWAPSTPAAASSQVAPMPSEWEAFTQLEEQQQVSPRASGGRGRAQSSNDRFWLRRKRATHVQMQMPQPKQNQTNPQVESAQALAHSNLFWDDPLPYLESAPHRRRLAVLLLNASHCSWRVKQQESEASDDQSKSSAYAHASELFWNCWSNADVTICADGGANRLFDRSKRLEAENLVIPKYIKGDLDSLRQDVREFYASKGTQVVHDPDQNSNDLEKCLQLVYDLQKQEQESQDASTLFSVMIFGAMGGRFDQEIQNVNALFRWTDKFEYITLLSEDTTATLLRPGKHEIFPNFHFEKRTCGLVPLAGACTETTTQGLRWNLAQQSMGFGGLISTSNHVESTPVIVENSHPLIWTTSLKK